MENCDTEKKTTFISCCYVLGHDKVSIHTHVSDVCGEVVLQNHII